MDALSFWKDNTFFEKSLGVEDSIGTPPRSHSDAAIPQQLL